MKTKAINSQGRVVLVLVLICAWLTCQAGVPDYAAPPSKTNKSAPAAAKKVQYNYVPGSYEEDTLLIMPAKGSEQEEIDKAIKETGGTVVGKIQHKDTTIYKLSTPKGKLAEIEKTLSADENFKQVVRNVNLVPNATSTTGDPRLASEWHLNSVRASDAWRLVHYNKIALAPVLMCVIDSGCQASITDLSGGRCQPGLDTSSAVLSYAVPGGGQIDVNNHGTWVATTAAANPNNGVGTAGVAPNAFIYPIRIVDSTNKPPGIWQLIKSLIAVEDLIDSGTPIKIVNLSANGTPPDTLANQDLSKGQLGSTIKPYIDEIYNRGAIIFNSAGNQNKLDQSPMNPHLCVVSAITSTNTRASFSNYGPSVWFTAPGQNIFCTGRTGVVQAVPGTSFSTPICAAVAALIWGVQPSLTNTQVLTVMTQTANRTKLKSYSAYYFGYGIPDCVQAIQKVRPGLLQLPLPPERNNHGLIDTRLVNFDQRYPAAYAFHPSDEYLYQRLLKRYQELMQYFLYYD